ncbi:FKBP-type peptidyl-prolyl cis-trans isomerase [Candidatus Parcubacteria bacterium]|uniref:Peptidyl-prolyl cis-trans isomerase n=1 Tax=Candidatus Kaiserbacteria bacterium CG10_big_fil_rev_8_21_14_0_10_47_16 TaxID=1974608 RepID=A0A2H0UE26_9BACT|nr:FKBP-type peptidyl-prolyl cis-trans isomerase [Candidatus Parcubacteria bacterium]PIR84652.1 MAG: peptidylprolyl isomerase [Candidatus Kaiserbacteria bacterium CG10_big_fil_rev_8_21_14_0_10_47_16]
MALVLAIFQFQNIGDAVAQLGGGSQSSAVVVATGDDVSIADAVSEAATTKGDLKKLIIDDVRAGTGPEVKKGDTVTVQYVGTTKEGVKFDSSYERGEPFTFTVGTGKVIEGWDEGILGMKIGGQRILVVPAEMAYGNAQVGPIAPNSVLVFSIELLEVK